MRTFLFVLLLAACPLASFAAQPDATRPAIDSLEQQVRERPSDPALWFFLARSQSESGDRRAMLASLTKVYELGDGFLPPRRGFARFWDDPEFAALRSKMDAKLPRLDFAPNAFELEDRGVIPEGVAYDGPSHSFFVGSIAQRRILRLGQGTLMTQFAGSDSKLDAVLGIAVDSPRRLLYAVTTAALGQGPRVRRNAIVAFDIDTQRQVARYEVPDALQLNDVAVAPGGRVFTSDLAGGAVFEVAVKGPGPTRAVVPAGRLPGANGLAASPDASRLYVAHSTGIGVVDLASGTLAPLENPTRENIAAIGGLYQWQGELIAVQSVTNPGRVIAITLDHDGRAVTRVQTLLSHHHNALDEPTTGAVAETGFYLLAATGVSHFDGAIEDPATVPAPTVLRVLLPR